MTDGPLSNGSENRLFRVAAALLALHLLLWLASAVGVAWSRPLVVVLWLGPAALVPALFVRRPSPSAAAGPRRSLVRPASLRGVSILLGLGAFGALALASWLGWNVHADWIFHWGPKAQRFALAEGIDLQYLTRPWNGHIHPDYPTLLPNLTASLALALGVDVTIRLGAVVTLLFAALWLLALRSLAFRCLALRYPTLYAHGARDRGWCAEAAWLTAAWSVTLFGIGFRQAAGADLPFACAVTLGALALAATRGEMEQGLGPDVRVGLAAAFASQIKFEGSVFAALLVALWLVRRVLHARETRRLRGLVLLRRALAAGLLPAVLVALWALWNRHHGLFLPSNVGGLDPTRLGTVLRGLAEAALKHPWYGQPLALLALPWLCLHRDVRWPALLLAGQLAAYVGVYLTTPVDLELLLLTSASRLLYHLVPTGLVLLVIALGATGRPHASA